METDKKDGVEFTDVTMGETKRWTTRELVLRMIELEDEVERLKTLLREREHWHTEFCDCT